MSQATIESAQRRFAMWKTGLSSFKVTDVLIQPGNANSLLWKQDGVLRSANIPEIASNDADYVRTFKELLGQASAGGSKTLEGSVSTSPIVLIAIAVGLFIAGRWLLRKMKRRRR